VGFIAFVIVPLVVLIWIVTGVLAWSLRDTPERREWVDRNRWWALWPILAVYLGILGDWMVGVVVLLLGGLTLGLYRRRALG
jgi:hypothetical protein